ncbi:putative alpha-mannosidase [Helianthus anomalus]
MIEARPRVSDGSARHLDGGRSSEKTGRLDLILFSLGELITKIELSEKGINVLKLSGGAPRVLVIFTGIFAGAFPENYEPPPGGFYFEVNDDSPIVQVNITRTNHVMWTMVTDFKYQYAESWFQNMDKFIHYVNKVSWVNALYSTPSIYTDAKHVEPDSWPLKEDNYFPYASDIDAYWTAYFTSRAGLKGYVRMLSGHYLAARQLEVMTGRNKTGPTIDYLGDALGIAQHHDAVSAVGIVGTWTVVCFGMQNGNRYLFVNIFFADKITDFSYHLITFFKSLHHGGVDMIRSGRDKIETLQQVIYLFYKFLLYTFYLLIFMNGILVYIIIQWVLYLSLIFMFVLAIK